MDNLCHTLVGAAIGECGARKATPLATATLLIGANLPDVDVLAYAAGPVEALGFRRGWTHGVLAVALWPFILAGLVLAWDRLVRRRRRPAAPPVRPRALVGVAALAVASHPLLDLLNTYGVRLLMPFSGRWFYGDTLFIVDPYVWLALLTAILLARRAERLGRPAPHRPARLIAALVVAYIAAMAGASAWARRGVERWFAAQGWGGAAIVISPAPADPLRAVVIARVADGYVVGRWDWRRRPHLRGPWSQIASQSGRDFALRAAATRDGRTYLSWARLPAFVAGGAFRCPGDHTCIRDARYWLQAWAEVAIPADAPVSSRAPVAEELP